MMIDRHLADVAAMPVEGRQGWQVKQVIRFGKFEIGPVKRGWTKGYDYPFIIRFTSAKEKLEFETRDGEGRLVRSFCAGKLSEQDFHKFYKYFDINLRSKDLFSCSIAVEGREQADFYVHDLNQNRTSGTVKGMIKDAGHEFEIRPVWHLDSGKKSWDIRPLGMEFVSDGQVVGAVESIDNGRVWLHPDLNSERQLTLARSCRPQRMNKLRTLQPAPRAGSLRLAGSD